MTDQQHPITPPPQLVQQWFKQAHESADPANQLSYYDFIATAAAQWGADQELEACVAWLDGYEREGWAAHQLCNDRRPKPPSLKEQALKLMQTYGASALMLDLHQCETIRRALEALPND
jgi:hypothetical protein